VYVWATEQDELSKRKVIADEEPPPLTGKDVVVPWVLSKELGMQLSDKDKKPQIFNRYYHMFAKGELPGLVKEAAKESGLCVGPKPESGDENLKGVEIVQDGWERSNYYVELRLWKTS
jgi:tRNA (uracil-5-)-methyltransferase TRM9